MSTDEPTEAPGGDLVPPLLARLAAWSWRLLVIGAAIYVALSAMSQLRLVLIPVVVALLLTTLLSPPARALVKRGVPPLVAAWTAILVLVLGSVALGVAIVTPLVDELDDLGSSLDVAADDIEDWLVDGPLGLERAQVNDAREQLADAFAESISSESGLVDGAVLVGEVLAGMLLAIVITFFLIKDGPALQRSALAVVPERHRDRAQRMASAAWSTLGRYVLGAAILGAVEATIMGITLTLVGSNVVLPVVALTFVAAFFPFVGAIVAGTVATLVTLASSGVDAAAIVAVVAIVVQQFDNDLLAPVIYGRALKMHPLAVILAVATGAAAAGLTGALVAVPVVAIALNASAADREARAAGTAAPEAPGVDSSA